MKERVLPTFGAVCVSGFIVGILAWGYTTGLILPVNTLTQAPCIEERAEEWECFEAYYEKLATDRGVAAAFTELKARFADTAYVEQMCHTLAHTIGHVGARMYPRVSEAFLHGDNFCWSGYYHGVMEEVSGKVGHEELIANVDTVCAGIPGKESLSFLYYNCVHGLGHGFMAITENEVPESLRACDALDGKWEENACYGGVFMENIQARKRNNVTNYLKDDDLMYPCNALDDRYKEYCYLGQTTYILEENGGDFPATFSACRNAEAAYRNACFHSIGRDASSRTVHDTNKVLRICQLGQTGEEQYYCLIGAARDFVSFYHSDAEGIELCNSAGNAQLSASCREEVDILYRDFK